jgi:dihydrofolate reductase
MRKLTVTTSLTLDGVMQAPGRTDEDPRGGFGHGGWALPYADGVMMQAMGEGMSHGADLLFGRRTYLDFFQVWPKRSNNPFTTILNQSQKFVASNTLGDPLPWENSTLLSGDAAERVARLKASPGKDIAVLGSGDLLQTLIRRRLVDQFVLLIHPLVLGSGRRLFADAGDQAALQLVKSVNTTTGVIIATYAYASIPDRHLSA